MEYVRGVCLRKLLKSGPLPLLRAINLAHQCAGALGHAHNMQVIHRDFTPDNVMLSKLLGRDHVKVLDLGIAFLTGDESLTQPGDILGTAEYLSPEQARGEDVTGLSDEYALGLVLYYMLTGQAAVESDTFLGYLHLHQNVMPDPPSSLRQEPGVELLDPIVLRMVAKRAEERFPNMAEVQKELERVLELLLLRNKVKKRT
jgi:serine/threonine-protein kinase